MFTIKCKFKLKIKSKTSKIKKLWKYIYTNATTSQRREPTKQTSRRRSRSSPY